MAEKFIKLRMTRAQARDLKEVLGEVRNSRECGGKFVTAYHAYNGLRIALDHEDVHTADITEESNE